MLLTLIRLGQSLVQDPVTSSTNTPRTASAGPSVMSLSVFGTGMTRLRVSVTLFPRLSLGVQAMVLRKADNAASLFREALQILSRLVLSGIDLTWLLGASIVCTELRMP